MAVSAGPNSKAIEKVVAEYFAAINALDADAFVGCFAEDGATHDPEGAPPHEGPAGVRAFFDGLAQLCESCEITPRDVFVSGSGAAAPWTLVARGKNGRDATAAGVDVITVNGAGRIQELHAYWDPSSFIGTLTS